MLYLRRLKLNALVTSLCCCTPFLSMSELATAEAVEVIEQVVTPDAKTDEPAVVTPVQEEPLITKDQAFFLEVNSLMRIAAYDQAIEKLEAYIRLNPESKDARHLLLNARIQQNEQHLRDTLKAEADLHETMVDPEYLAAKTITDKAIAQRLSVVEYLAKEEKYADALRLLNEVLVMDPNNHASLLLKDRLVESMLRIERKRLEAERKIQREKAINDITKRGNQEDPKEPIPRVYQIFQEDLNEIEREKLMTRLRVPLKSFNYTEAPLDSVLKQLFAIAGLNYIIYDQAIGDDTLTLSLRDETVESVLYTIQRMANVRFNYHGGSVYVTSVDNPILVTEVVRLRSGLTNVSKKPQLQAMSGGQGGANGGQNAQGGAGAAAQAQLFGAQGQGAAAGDELSDVEKFLEMVPELMEWPTGSTIFLDKKSSTVMVRSSPATISEFKRLLQSIDYVTEQVLIEARFVEVSDSATRDFGFNWTILADNQRNGANPNKFILGGASSGQTVNPLTDFSNPANQFTLGQTLATTKGFFGGVIGQGNDVVPNFAVQLNALEEKGDINTLSEPKILTLSNATGIIDIRSDIAYIADIENRSLPNTVNTNDGGTTNSDSNFAGVPRFETDYEGINLTVTPSVAVNGEVVTLVVTPVVRELISLNTEVFIVPGAGDTGLRVQQPSFSTRQISTTLHVRNGETIVLGGLISERDNQTQDGIPGLSGLPVVGGLFRHRRKENTRSRLLIFITATIIDPSGASYEKQIERLTDTASVVLPMEVQQIKAANDKAERDAQTARILNGTDKKQTGVRAPNSKQGGRR